VRFLLARQDVELNQAKADKTTALYAASQNGHLDVVQLLLTRQLERVKASSSMGGRGGQGYQATLRISPLVQLEKKRERAACAAAAASTRVAPPSQHVQDAREAAVADEDEVEDEDEDEVEVEVENEDEVEVEVEYEDEVEVENENEDEVEVENENEDEVEVEVEVEDS
jgi:hypothetical protein